ncbi:MAG: PEP-CTERM sorting domain-containing protein [Alphaproteobacteria bacterium]|nr:PEP-CTERM sorting domain-containing protein [Alphaproteobacteria bacterium]MCB9928850.1 PEP-CTERM sorting domain-containing protein [Alphaproteobacteria bacterium]
MMRILSLAAVAVLFSGAASAAPLQVYFNDMDGGETFGAGVTGSFMDPVGTVIESVQGFAGLGLPGNQFSGDFARNISNSHPGSSLTLQLNNLPSHDSVDIGFLFAAIDSWDSDNGSVSPDWFEVLVDGALITARTFANASGSNTSSFGVDIGSGLVNRGFSSYSDRAFDTNSDPALDVAHSASTLTVEFRSNGAGWQGGSDESWAIDNLNVSINTTAAVPEPAGLALALGGVLGIAALRRRG